MTTSYSDQFVEGCDHKGPPRAIAPLWVGQRKLPAEFVKFISLGDGMVYRDRLVRIFGEKGNDQVPSLEEWNDSEWKRSYAQLSGDLIFIGEDLLGDQYGYWYGEPDPCFVKFWSEGGELQRVANGLAGFLRMVVDPITEDSLIDHEFMGSALSAGLRPGCGEHLAFKLPLIAGGSYELENVGIEPIALHLGMLSQMSVKSRTLADGTPIARFVEEE